MKWSIIIGSILAVVIVCGVAYFSPAEEKIGGQRDEHGCLGPAGYSWNENIGACIREWELNTSEKEAAKMAVIHTGQQEGLTVTDVHAIDEGYNVVLEAYNTQFNVTVKNP